MQKGDMNEKNCINSTNHMLYSWRNIVHKCCCLVKMW